MNQLSLLPEIQIHRRRPQEPIVREAAISEGCRWWLKRAWGSGPCIAWCGLNPSNADGQRDDPTMWREMEFSMAWGFGSLVKVNLIPFISSTPAAAMAWLKRAAWDQSLGASPSDEFIQFAYNVEVCAAELSRCEMRMAAWGNGAPAEYLRDWMNAVAAERYLMRALIPTGADLERNTIPVRDWHCLGTNENGSPRHTLSRGKNRVPADFKPLRWAA